MYQYKTVTHFNLDILYFLWNNTNTETNLAVFPIKQQVISFIQIGWKQKNLSSCICPLQLSCHKGFPNSNGPLTPNQSILYPLPSLYFSVFIYTEVHIKHVFPFHYWIRIGRNNFLSFLSKIPPWEPRISLGTQVFTLQSWGRAKVVHLWDVFCAVCFCRHSQIDLGQSRGISKMILYKIKLFKYSAVRMNQLVKYPD